MRWPHFPEIEVFAVLDFTSQFFLLLVFIGISSAIINE